MIIILPKGNTDDETIVRNSFCGIFNFFHEVGDGY